jgi:hypothetical protein
MNDYRRPSLFWPLLIIGLGVLLLLQNLNLLPAGLWAALAQLWPVLLVLIGLDMLLGRRSRAGTAAVLLLGTLLVAGALAWAALRASQLPPGGVQTIVQPGGDAAALSVDLDFRAGDLRVSALEASENVLEGEAHHGRGERARLGYAVRGGTGELTLRQETNALLLPFLAGSGATARWEVGLAADLPLTLDISTGAGATTLDLTGLQLEALYLSTGVGQTRVLFPAAGRVIARVNTGVGATTFSVPADRPARITVRSGLASLSVPPRFARSGNVYTTAGFDAAADTLDLEVSAGIGQVVVE